MRRRMRFLSALAALTLPLACRDGRDALTAPREPGSPSRVTAVDLNGRILALADSIFPKGLANAFNSQWTNVQRQLAATPNGTLSNGKKGPGGAARKMLVELTSWVS